MHFAILVEDQSGKAMLDVLVPKIASADDTFEVHPYKGIGHLPKGLNPKTGQRFVGGRADQSTSPHQSRAHQGS